MDRFGRNIAYVLTVGLVVFIVSYALAVAMNISGVSFLGGGEANVSTPNVTSVSWVFQRHGNRWVVVGVSLTFDGDLPAGSTIYVDLLNSNDETIAYGSLTLSSNLPSGNSVTVNTSPAVRAQDIAKIAISVAGP
ncbi:hypothetical protein [Thermofilum sp.]|uniref:hypothetical protein n=1 Tax=Thermofilum sp. TaxID=1961369 RepID=UPI00315FD842